MSGKKTSTTTEKRKKGTIKEESGYFDRKVKTSCGTKLKRRGGSVTPGKNYESVPILREVRTEERR